MKKRLLAIIPVLLVVFLCSGNVFANSTATTFFSDFTWLYPSGASSTSTSDLYSYITISSFEGEQSSYVQAQGSSTGGIVFVSYDRWIYKALVRLKISNRTSNDIRITQDRVDYMIKPANSVDLVDMKVIQVSGIIPYGFRTNGVVNFAAEETLYDNYIIIPAMRSVYAVFELTYAGYEVANTGSAELMVWNNTNTHWSSPSIPVPITTGDFNQYTTDYITDIYDELVQIYQRDTQTYNTLVQMLSESVSQGTTLDNIESLVSEIVDSYNDNISGSEDVTDDSTSLTTQSDTIHNQESAYYTQTNTALANTGLSNFSFGNTTVAALGLVKDQFTYVWNKLDTYSIVFTFSLTLGVALLIIRHVRPIRRHKEE